MAGMTGDGSRGSGSGGVLQAAVVVGFGAGAGNGGGGGAVGPCGACKFLRRKCVAGCIFSPYFRAEEGASYFAAVHKVFGASNVSKLLAQIPDDKRLDAVATICYEAQARLRDAVYGCTSHINALQQQAATLQSEVAYLQAQIAQLELRSPPPHTATPPLPPSPPPFSVIFGIPPSPSTVSTTTELASIFSTPDDQLPWPPLIMHQQEEAHPQQRPPQQEEQQQQHNILELQQLLDGTGDGSCFIQNALEIREYLQWSLANDLIQHPIDPPPSMSK